MNKTKERPTSQPITVNIDKLSAMLSCGHATARKIGEQAGAKNCNWTQGSLFGRKSQKLPLISGRITPFFIYVSCDIWYNIYRHNHVMRTKKGAITERNVSHGK